LIHFLRGKGLGLVSINKLEQLRKYIFDIDIERTQIKQVSNPKGNFVGIDKTFSIKIIYMVWESAVHMIL